MKKSLGVKVDLKKSFPLLRETLERMGVRNKETKKFFPSCYCVQDNDKKGDFKIYHFKELFLKEGKESNYNDLDELRRNTVIHFLVKWGFIEICDEENEIDEIMYEKIDVLSHADKKDYTICHKYYFKRKV